MTVKKYLNCSELSGTFILTEIGDDGEPFVRLNATIFHPQGGGQKADLGTIASRVVKHVAKNGDEVNHYLESTEGLAAGDTVVVVVDGGWRRANSSWHTAGHLIAAIIEQRWPELRAVGGHHWAGKARVEFAKADALPAEAIAEELPGLVDRAIEANLPVRVVGDPFTARAIAIGEFPPVPCGGTHVSCTAELPTVEITRVRTREGRLRISYALKP